MNRIRLTEEERKEVAERLRKARLFIGLAISMLAKIQEIAKDRNELWEAMEAFQLCLKRFQDALADYWIHRL